MKNTEKLLASLNERLRQLPEPTIRWAPDDGHAFAIGQAWRVAGGCGDQPTWLWLILECLDHGLANAAPLFLWGELAGPEDVYLPREYAGVTAIVSFELECTLDHSACADCCGRFPRTAVDTVLAARAEGDDPARRHAYTWGLDYLDEHDQRLAYHDAIGKTIERLQAPVRAGVFAGETGADPIPFPSALVALYLTSFQARKAAAAGTGEEWSRCLITTSPGPAVSEIREEEPPEKVWIRCLSFRTLRPDAQDSPVLEWVVELALSKQGRAFVYETAGGRWLGEAVLNSEPNGTTLVTLTCPDLVGLPETIDTPEKLVVLIVVPEQE